MFNYVNLPDYIIKKYKKGIISKPHFSDLLRSELLCKYGGTWIDATLLFTNKIPQDILDSNLYLFLDPNFESQKVSGSNWFIHSCKNNPIMELQKELLFHYWKHYNKAINYYFWHIMFFDIVLKLYSDEWRKELIRINNQPKLLNCILFDEYNKNRYNHYINATFCHKITYKHEQELYNKQNTYYKQLLKDFM